MSQLIFNPENSYVDLIPGEAAIPIKKLGIESLRQRFTNMALNWVPEDQEEQLYFKNGEYRPAAVLVPLVVREKGLTLLLTRRAADLTYHPGQISLPGGRFEQSDLSLVETALRETEEEVGLNRDHIEILGSLPDHRTVTGFHITPIVSLIFPPFELHADKIEVSEIFEVPLAYLMNGKNHQRRRMALPTGEQRSFYAIPYEHYFIWGATASILRNLFHFLRV